MTTQQATQRPQQRTQQQPAQPKQIDPDEKLLDDIMSRTVTNIDKANERFSVELNAPGIGQFLRSIKKAKAIEMLRAMITPVMPLIHGLKNSPMGFLTDEKEGKSPYPDELIRDCVIEAMLNGVNLDGNEFNIIASKCYITQAGYWHKLKEIDGITDIDVTPGVPAMYNGQMVCRVRANWKLKGVSLRLIGADGKDGRAFAIKAGTGSTPDNITGKALRKAYKAIYEKCTGSTMTEPDEEAEVIVPTVVATQEAGEMPNGRSSLKKDDGELADGNLLDQVQMQFTRVGMVADGITQTLIRHNVTNSRDMTVFAAKAILKELEPMPTMRQPGDEAE